MKLFFTHPSVKNLQAFLSFYDKNAPKLWELITSANLPVTQSKTILTNTLLKAWQQADRQAISEPYLFNRLVDLAHAEGLPTDKQNPGL